MTLLAVIAPVVLVLSGFLGVLIGWWLVEMVRRPTEQVRREREQQVAKETARRVMDDVLGRLRAEQQ